MTFKNASLLIVVPIAGVIMLYASLAKVYDTSSLMSRGLPRLEEVRTYKVPRFPNSASEFLVGETPTAVAWSPDGKRIAAFSGYGQNLTVWNIDGSPITVLHPEINFLGQSLAFLDDDRLLTPPENARTDPASMHLAFDIWSIQTGGVLRRVNGPEPAKNWGANLPHAYALSPDRNTAVMIAQQTGTHGPLPEQKFKETPVPFYSTKTWDITRRIPVTFPMAFAFSPDGKKIAFGQMSPATIQIYDTSDLHLIRTITACEDDPSGLAALAFSPDGQLIAASSANFMRKPTTCGLRIFRIADGNLIATYPDEVLASKILWHPGDKFIVFASHGKTFRVWNPYNPSDPGTMKTGVNALCMEFSPDGRQLASCNDDGITVFNINY